jgi:serine/threonine protein kinase
VPRRPTAGDRVGDLVLEEQVGEGAMGIVFRARREEDGAVVAVKVLRPELSGDETYRQRFQREVRVAAEARHPNLLRILGSGRADGLEYIVVDYAPGGTLADRLARGGRPSLAFAVSLAAQVAGALDALHRETLVHRDVKPSNIMLTEAGEAALTDFGLASGRAYTVLTRPGQVLGTLDYIAPELISGRQATPASDIYAFACVLFELLVGHAPFESKSIYEVAVAHLEEAPPSPSELRPELPAEIDEVVLYGLAKKPAERPRTATALARLLEAAVRG